MNIFKRLFGSQTKDAPAIEPQPEITKQPIEPPEYKCVWYSARECIDCQSIFFVNYGEIIELCSHCGAIIKDNIVARGYVTRLYNDGNYQFERTVYKHAKSEWAQEYAER